jgi:transposase
VPELVLLMELRIVAGAGLPQLEVSSISRTGVLDWNSPPMSKQQSKFGRRYDEAFKRQAVEWIETQQRSIRDLSRELGVSEWSLSRWCKQYANGAAAGGSPGGGGPPAAAATLEAEVARLRREVEVVSRQRDILKKALAILGQEPWNATK